MATIPKPGEPGYMAWLGRRGGQKNKARHAKNKKYFSNLAKKSHPKNNPNSTRTEYTGGRPKGKKVNVADSAGTGQ